MPPGGLIYQGGGLIKKRVGGLIKRTVVFFNCYRNGPESSLTDKTVLLHFFHTQLKLPKRTAFPYSGPGRHLLACT